MTDSVLVACPTYAGKEYCLDQWVEAYSGFYHEPKQALMVDNTRASDKYSKLIDSKGVTAVHLDPFPTFEKTFHHCWQIIHQEAIMEGHDWVLSMEADTIPKSKEALDRLLSVAHAGDLELVTHTYPVHIELAMANGMLRGPNKHRFVYNELGFCLMSTRLLGLALADTSRYGNFTMSLFQSAARYLTGWATCCKLIEIDHLDGYFMEYRQFIEDEADGRTNPVGPAPDHYASELPPSIREDYEELMAEGQMTMGKGHFIKSEAMAKGSVIHPDGTQE